MKRGQVTLLVIIGIILLFTVSILFYLNRVSYTDQLQAQAQETVNQFVESNSLSQYVSTCLNRVASEGLELLGRQGGVIYQDQGGLTENSLNPDGKNYLRYENNNISYAIIGIQQSECINYQQHNPATFFLDIQTIEGTNHEYPVEGVSFQDYQQVFASPLDQNGCGFAGRNKNLQKSGFLGYNVLSPLCTEETQDDIGGLRSLVGSSIVCSNEFSESVNPQTDNVASIERQLELYIQNRMFKTLQGSGCFDKSIYEELGDEIDIDDDNFAVDVYFTDPRGILIDATFPFEVSIQGEKPIVTLVDFQQNVNINFLELYRFMHELTTTMAKDPFFDFNSLEYQNWNSYQGKGFGVELLSQSTFGGSSNPYSFTHDDILRITSADQLNGEPYIYQVALRQQRPVLDHISEVQFPFQDTSGNAVTIDYLLYPGQPLEFEVAGMDPNSDSYEIALYGWKETTDSYFDVDCCTQRGCTIDTYSQCQITSEQAPQLNFERCRLGDECSVLALEQNTLDQDLFLDAVYEPRELSSQFTASDRFVSLEVDETDTGYHEILVTITDEHGAIDFQIIRILVYDIPLAQLTLENFYADILPLYASIEEPFIFDPTLSRASAFNDGTDLSSFLFRIYPDGYDADDFDLNRDSEFILSENRELIIPGDDYDFTTIRNDLFEADLRNGIPREDAREIEVSLEVQQTIANGLEAPPSLPDIQTLFLHECLPVGYDRSNNLLNSPDLLDNYDISAYPDPYYSRYLSGIPERDKFNMPNVCCQPLARDAATAPHAGGEFADQNEVCYQRTFQTCYPPELDFLYRQQFLKNAVTEDAQANLIPLEETNLLRARPAGGGSSPNSPFPHAVNDVWTLEQVQSCSGNRGNACSGTTEFTWSGPVVCADLDDLPGQQFARCEGPGQFTNPYTSFTQCYSRIETGMQCLPFAGESSFEQTVLFVRDGNEQGHTPQNALAIRTGYCAGPQRATLATIQNEGVEASVQGDFSCFGSCGGSGTAGSCAYSADNCFCQERPATNQDLGVGRVTASHFLNNEVFSCSDDGRAFSNQCQVFGDDTAPSCFCQSPESTNAVGGVDQLQLDLFPRYFGDKQGDWRVQGGTCCLQGSGVFASMNGVNDGGDLDRTTCFDGELQGADTIFSSQGLTNRFLSYQGQVYYCASQQNDPFITSTSLVRSFVSQIIYSQDFGGTPGFSSFIGRNQCTAAGWSVP